MLFKTRKDGYLFDKEAILQYIITKKNEYSRKLKEFEKLKKKEGEELQTKHIVEGDRRVSKFVVAENNIVSKPIDGFKPGEYSFVNCNRKYFHSVCLAFCYQLKRNLMN